MDNDAMRSLPARMGVSRRISVLAAVVSFVAITTGCAGGGGQLAQPEDVRTLAGVAANHGLDPGSRITVESGMSEDRGNVTIHCPADTHACEIVVAADGSVGYDPSGGVPAIVPLSPAPNAVEDLLRRRLNDSTWPVAVSFGGGVATCQALGCPVIDAIHVDRPAAGGARHPSDDHRPDLSGFEPLEPRRGIALASKARTVREGERSAFHRAFGAWMDHGFLLVETFTMHGNAGSRYHTTWFGDASHAGPLTSPGDTATWSGVMTGVEASPSGGSGAFVHGDAAITVSGLAAGTAVSVDVAFTNIVNEDTGAGIGDMVWQGLPLQGRAFGTGGILFNDGAEYFPDESFGVPAQGSIYGRLYGPGHEEVGGLFHRDGIAGAFAGKRDR
ncbi:MAG: hypothetical protein OXN81_20105 [Alphaproteobacteria bacterium]|nr:hypothetical protein [Alphaproteobacteria bacterium]